MNDLIEGITDFLNPLHLITILFHAEKQEGRKICFSIWKSNFIYLATNFIIDQIILCLPIKHFGILLCLKIFIHLVWNLPVYIIIYLVNLTFQIRFQELLKKESSSTLNQRKFISSVSEQIFLVFYLVSLWLIGYLVLYIFPKIVYFLYTSIYTGFVYSSYHWTSNNSQISNGSIFKKLDEKVFYLLGYGLSLTFINLFVGPLTAGSISLLILPLSLPNFSYEKISLVNEGRKGFFFLLFVFLNHVLTLILNSLPRMKPNRTKKSTRT